MTEPANRRGHRPAAHNVVAGFLDRGVALQAVDALEKSGIPRDEIVVDSRSDEAELMRAEMREEVDEAVAGPSIGLYNKQMVKGAAAWTVAGVTAGALIGLVVGVALSGWFALLISVIAFALAGATAGFVAGGFSRPRSTEDYRDSVHEVRTTVGVHSDVQGHVEQAGPVFARLGAEQVERFDSEGNPVPELRERSGYETHPSKTGRRFDAHHSG